jgi:signal transduction histidine kinase
VRVILDGDARRMMLDVVDDGAGIAAPLARGRPGHLGIVGMRERAIAIGARFGVDTQAEGGTRVTLRWEAREP